MKKVIIGLDIGGTTVKIGLLTIDGEIIKKWEIPTNKKENGKYVVREIWQSVLQTLASANTDQKNIVSIVAGAPGFVDRKSGIIYEAVNIGWKNYDLSDELKALANMPVFIENDANLAALGENWKGAGAESKNMIHITLGTGVGGGIIANGEIISGANGTAGEIGHITVERNGSPCNCGRRGCLETISSATGMVRQANELILKKISSKVPHYFQKKREISTKDIFYLANEGDKSCQQIIQRAADALGLVLANLSVVINPSVITVGGGLSKSGDSFIKAIEYSFQKYALTRISEVCDFKIAELGNDAGIIGAAMLAKNNHS